MRNRYAVASDAILGQQKPSGDAFTDFMPAIAKRHLHIERHQNLDVSEQVFPDRRAPLQDIPERIGFDA